MESTRTRPSPTSQGSVCEHLEWDSQFFGRRMARVAARKLTPETAAAVLGWCDAERVECLYFLADASDPATVRTAENHGFSLVDVRVTFERRGAVPHLPRPAVILRQSNSDDVPALTAMARTSFRLTRFYADPHFLEARADELYATWIEKSCRGYAEGVLVAEHDGEAVGCVTLHVENPATGKIGLICVRDDWHGRGVGRALVNGALTWCEERELGPVRVVTQGRNVAALRLYERCGFVVESVEFWYHRWFEREAEA